MTIICFELVLLIHSLLGLSLPLALLYLSRLFKIVNQRVPPKALYVEIVL